MDFPPYIDGSLLGNLDAVCHLPFFIPLQRLLHFPPQYTSFHQAPSLRQLPGEPNHLRLQNSKVQKSSNPPSTLQKFICQKERRHSDGKRMTFG